MTEVLIVLTNLPDRHAAESMASELVARRLAACVNVLAPCHSVYRWKAAVESAQEVPLLIKCLRRDYAALEAAIRAGHPYELPEILAVPVERGLPGYLGWIAGQTAGGAADDAPD